MKDTGECNITVPLYKPRSKQNMFASPKRLNSLIAGGIDGYKSQQGQEGTPQHIHQGNIYNGICVRSANIQLEVKK